MEKSSISPTFALRFGDVSVRWSSSFCRALCCWPGTWRFCPITCWGCITCRGRGSPLKVGEVGEGGSFRPLVFQIFLFHFPVFLHVWTSGEALAGFGWWDGKHRATTTGRCLQYRGGRGTVGVEQRVFLLVARCCSSWDQLTYNLESG